MRYAVARLKRDQRETAYRIYVTDTLRIITGVKKRYADFITPARVDSRSADEIVQQTIKNAGLEVVG